MLPPAVLESSISSNTPLLPPLYRQPLGLRDSNLPPIRQILQAQFDSIENIENRPPQSPSPPSLRLSSIPLPTTPKRQQLSRDVRLRITTLRDIGWTYRDIVQELGVSYKQVQWTCNTRITPQSHKRGAKGKLTAEDKACLVAFITANKKTRRMALYEVKHALGWTCSVDTIRRALKKEGFQRYVARRKPPLDESRKRRRLAWAQEHITWTRERWNNMLWTDETWVTGKKHRKTYVTRRKEEELHPDCIEESAVKRLGWMFWGSFSGRTGKGPSHFWEKTWGSINQVSYQEHTVPLILRVIRANPGLVLMQDGAPGHAARSTIQLLRQEGVTMTDWPPYSPDLNPIENIWNIMKDIIQKKLLNYGSENVSYELLRRFVIEAWEEIPQERFDELLDSMPARCQAVIDAHGGHTKW
jgi:transposase